MSIVKHGHTRRKKGGGRESSPTWQSFIGMKNRCLNPRQERFKDYGGRGITICDRWLEGEGGLSGFECFLADMGKRPEGLTLDRENNDGNYEPGNCRWATKKEQASNARNAMSIEVEGATYSLAEAVRRFGSAPLGTVRMRIWRGWDPIKAIRTPKGKRP